MKVSIYDGNSFFEFLDYLVEINNSLKEMEGKKEIDFARFHFFDLSTLFLASIHILEVVERWPNRLTGAYGNRPSENYYLARLGVMEVIPPTFRHNTPLIAGTNVSDKIFLFSSDVGAARGNETKIACKVADLMETSMMSRNEVSQIEMAGAAITEALANVRNWAYQNSDALPGSQKWWMVGSINPARNRLRVRVYDRGESIPAHITRTHLSDPILAALVHVGVASNDGAKIGAAFEIGANRLVQMQGRRRGLLEMRNLSNSFREGVFSVFSGRGHYESRTKHGIRQMHRQETLDNELSGTLIGWELLK